MICDFLRWVSKILTPKLEEFYYSVTENGTEDPDWFRTKCKQLASLHCINQLMTLIS